MNILLRSAALGALTLAASVQAQIVRSGSGSASNANVAKTAFEADLNAVVVPAGTVGPLFRTINWDGVPDQFAAPNNLPPNFFNVNSPRGAVFSTPGTGFQVSANTGNPTATPVEFGNLNPTYPGLFAPFTSQRLFTSLGSNLTDVTFFLPGTTTPGLTSGFGAVFTDVDLAGTSSIELFGLGNISLGTFFVPSAIGNETLSFLGISFDTPTISRVRIIAGNGLLSSGSNETSVTDLVALDDFVFGEVRGAAVPEPATWAMMITGFGFIGASMRRKHILATA